MELFTLSEMAFIAIISGIVSIIAIFLKGLLDSIISKKQLQDKYHTKIFDKKFEAYTELSSAMIYCAEIQNKSNEDKVKHLSELLDRLKEILSANYLILEDGVIDAFLSYANAVKGVTQKLEEGSDFSEEDKNKLIYEQSNFTNAMRKSLNLKIISKPHYS